MSFPISLHPQTLPLQAQLFRSLFAAPRFRSQQPDPFGRDRGDTAWDREIPLPDEGKALEAARGAWRSGASLRDLFGDTATGIHGSIGKTNGRNRPGDVFKLQALLHKLGYRDAMGTDGPTGYLGSFDHEPIMAFQRDHGLQPDGMLEPGGETIRTMQNFAQRPEIAGGPANTVVQVRAYQQTRDGKNVQVAAHERSAPGGGAGNDANTPGDAAPRKQRATAIQGPNRTTHIERPDGSIEVREGGTAAWRNNNPGNIRHDPNAIGKAHGFAVYPTLEEGEKAKESLIDKKRDRGLTVNETIEEWAPPEENNTAKYQATVSKWTGIPGNTKLKDLSPKQRKDLSNAFKRYEGWREGTVKIMP